MEWKVGQRVYSATEPELGLGEIETVPDTRVVQIKFELAGQRRRYTARGSHLKRVEIKAGDQAILRDGRRVQIQSVEPNDETFYFDFLTTDGSSFDERSLHPKQVFSNVRENFLAGRWSDPKLYSLICDTFRLRPQGDKRKAALLASNRIGLLGHQLYVAWKAADQLPVRLLLSDEVGLGKTIESGLIATMLLGLGLAQRVIITCPDALQNQWLAEVYRRFNIVLSMFPPDLFEPAEVTDFLRSHRHILVPWSQIPVFLTGFQTARSPFDLLILDEAHQLLSEEFLESEDIGLAAIEFILSTKNCLFLTATPKFLGNATEFRLLNLLNDEEFGDYETYLKKVESLKTVDAALKEIPDSALENKATPKLDRLLAKYPRKEELKRLAPGALRTLIADVWGYGNTVVRNRRAKLHFDIQRNLQKVRLEPQPTETASGLEAYRGLASFPAKLIWLAEYLRQNPLKKYLIIASDKSSAIKVHRELADKNGFRAALFHEDMDLVQRDRAAEWFHQSENGAQVLVSSEIGGEGRNFQHADGLILLDLPLEPNLLEQRIGRLDRIGRKGAVEVIVPFGAGAPEEFLLEWYDEALEIFLQPWNGELDMTELANSELLELLPDILAKKATARKGLQKIVDATRAKVIDHRRTSGEALETLLDLQSYDPARADTIRKLCESSLPFDFLDFLERAFDYFDIDFSYIDDDNTFNVNASSLSFADDLAEFAKFEDRILTLDRDQALARENLTFLSIEHPVVRSLTENILQKGEGFATLALCDELPATTVLQIFFSLQIPPHRGWDLTTYFDRHCGELLLDESGKELRMAPLDEARVKRPKLEITPAFLKSLATRSEPALAEVEKLLAEKTKRLREGALTNARAHFDGEIEKLRLKSFAKTESATATDDTWMQERKREIETAIEQTEPRIEALRMLINMSRS